MKTGTIKYSQEFVNEIGLKRWIGIELQYDMNHEAPLDVYKEAEMQVRKFAQSQNPPGPPANINPYHVPVIDKSEERLGILIENASTLEELMAYKGNLSTPYLADLFGDKILQLRK